MTPPPIDAITPRQVGFTLIELMVVMLVMAIVTAAAAPAISGMAAERRHDAVGAHITGAIRLARSEALKRAALVVVEPQGGAGAWGGSLNLYADADGDPQDAMQGRDLLIRASVRASSVTTVSGPARLAIDPQGRNRSLQPQPALTESTIVLCTGGKARTLTVDRGGFASVSTVSASC
jgi:type II secretion system protein H